MFIFPGINYQPGPRTRITAPARNQALGSVGIFAPAMLVNTLPVPGYNNSTMLYDQQFLVMPGLVKQAPGGFV